MTLTELKEIRRQGSRPSLPVCLSTVGKLDIENPVITGDGDLSPLVGLDVYLVAAPGYPLNRLIKITDRLLGVKVKNFWVDYPSVKKLHNVITNYKPDIRDDSNFYNVYELGEIEWN